MNQNIANKIKAFVEQELAQVQDSRVMQHIQKYLVEPQPIERLGEHGDNNKYICWSVLDHRNSNTGIAYAPHYAQTTPWGLVFLSGDEYEMSMGYDSAWLRTFMDAYFESFVCNELDIWQVFIREQKEGTPKPITDEADWDSTWEQVMSLRESNPSHSYDCNHSIKFTSGY